MKNQTIKERILKYLKYQGVTKYEFYKKSDVTRGILDNLSGLSEENIGKFLDYAPEISTDWLIQGSGPWFKNDLEQHAQEMSVIKEPEPNYVASRIIEVVGRDNEPLHVMMPVKAQAGYLDNHSDPEWFAELPTCSLPGLQQRSLWLWEVEGNSMTTDSGGLHTGDWVVAERILEKKSIRDGRVYVIIHKDGVLIKRVLDRSQNENKLILKSDNLSGNYPAMVIDPTDVLELWYVVGYFSRQLPPPSNLYERINDLEGRLIMLEKTTEN